MCGIWILLKKNNELYKYIESINKIKNRGPDSTNIYNDNNLIVAFHRLSINDISIIGNQPFYYSNDEYNYILVANGEIYNHKFLEKEFNINIKSNSDCEFLLEFFIKLNENFISFNNYLRGEYAIIIIKNKKNTNNIEYWISTDNLSVRPLFYYINSPDIEIGISSLLGGLSSISDNVFRLDQCCYIEGNTDLETYNNYNINKYFDISTIKPILQENNILYNKIVSTLEESVKIRLSADRKIGCLLSGGLDSSLIAALASKELLKYGEKLKTFSIGMKGGTDLYYAKIVADHINSEHTEYYFTEEDGINSIEDVIKCTETYDITTIRASVGQYLIAKNILNNTDIKVILNGDGADECQMGYLYFYLCPNIEEGYKERNKLLEQIHMFDGLRVDRNISHFGLEARVPFLDKEFINLYYEIDPSILIPTNERMEKYLIRKAFEIIMPNLLPDIILWRKKEAFSDGVSSKEKSWYQIVKNKYEEIISDNEFNNLNNLNGFLPLCKESYYYRKKFNELYGNNERVIPRYWLPNWTDVKDPSARTLNLYK